MGQMKVPEEEPMEEEWIYSYADMVSLLMGFFVILFSMSKMDDDAFTKVSEALAEQFDAQKKDEKKPIQKIVETKREERAFQMLISILNLGDQDNAIRRVEKMYADKVTKDGLQSDLEEALKKTVDLQAKVGEGKSEKGDQEKILSLDIPTYSLFPKTSAVLNNAAMASLQNITSIFVSKIEMVDLEVIVHTSSKPPPKESGFANNWEISSARAIALAKAFTQLGIPGEKILVKGDGNLHPIFTEFDEKGQALEGNMLRNERIQISLRKPVSQEG